MKYKFDKNNKDKIASLLNIKDKCFYYEMEKLDFRFDINNNNWKFIYYHSFFSLIKDISDLSLFFLINEEISNSIERKPFPDLMKDIMENGYYKNNIIINGERINFNINKLIHTTNEIKELLVWKFNEILGSQLFDFNTSIFSAFEFWISKIYEKYNDEISEELLKSRKKRYKKLINDYNNSNNDKSKDEYLLKIIKEHGLYPSFPYKLDSIFKKLNKTKYIEHREIKKDKELIDIYANILSSIDNITIEDYIKEERDEIALNLFNSMISSYVLDKNNLNQEKEELIFSNLKKIIPNDDKLIKLLDFLKDIEDINENNLLLKTLCANLN